MRYAKPVTHIFRISWCLHPEIYTGICISKCLGRYVRISKWLRLAEPRLAFSLCLLSCPIALEPDSWDALILAPGKQQQHEACRRHFIRACLPVGAFLCRKPVSVCFGKCQCQGMNGNVRVSQQEKTKRDTWKVWGIPTFFCVCVVGRRGKTSSTRSSTTTLSHLGSDPI